MQHEFEKMDLVTIRNLFLEEMQTFLIAVELETPEQLERRKIRIRELDAALEEKKRIEREKRESSKVDRES
ncbi:MAG: hypothetical protein ACJ749_12970 [Flavisolibacter sp.]